MGKPLCFEGLMKKYREMLVRIKVAERGSGPGEKLVSAPPPQ
jgi:hypothetical protein